MECSMQPYTLVRNALSLFCSLLLVALSMTGAIAAELDVFHADSLAGPMRALKPAFEAKHPGATLKFTATRATSSPPPRPPSSTRT
jgi:ABC-type molybdate transport system substrate-binding protein